MKTKKKNNNSIIPDSNSLYGGTPIAYRIEPSHILSITPAKNGMPFKILLDQHTIEITKENGVDRISIRQNEDVEKEAPLEILCENPDFYFLIEQMPVNNDTKLEVGWTDGDAIFSETYESEEHYPSVYGEDEEDDE